MPQPGRGYQQTATKSYRFGFNGKENDNEVKGKGNQQDYGMRIYDTRLSRFLSVDPLTKSYPYYTPYAFSGNSPIATIDIDGEETGIPMNGVGPSGTQLSNYFCTVEGRKNWIRAMGTGIAIGGGVVADIFVFKGKITQALMATSMGSVFHHNTASTQEGRTAQTKASKEALTDVFLTYSTIKLISATAKGLSPFLKSVSGKVIDAFEGGGTKLVSSEMLAKFPNSPTFGPSSGTFIAPTTEINTLLSSGASRAEIASRLGITDPKFLKGELIRIDVTPEALKKLNLRPPAGTEAGANSAFVPGGTTVGGTTEGVVNGIPKNVSGVSISVVKQ
jgi:RHS repeat-associated protein